MTDRLPAIILGFCVATYWLCVVGMVIRVRPQEKSLGRVFFPAQRRERIMWLIWVPLIAAWIHMPFAEPLDLFKNAGNTPLAFTGSAPWRMIRWVGAGGAVLCLLLSIRCWLHMGGLWRMGVARVSQGRVIQDGPFAVVRHPIYALSIGLMVCSVLVLPAPAMPVVAVIHITLLNMKARNEEQFLLAEFGAEYADYCQRVGRFVPGLGSVSKKKIGLTDLPPGTTPLNYFQQCMWMWERLAPYNAIHAVLLPGPLRESAWRHAVREVCERMRLGRPQLDPRGRTLSFDTYFDAEFRVLRDSENPTAELERIAAAELEHSFEQPPAHPLRWIGFNCRGGAGHYWVLSYRHLIADAHGIQCLLSAILRAYLEPPPPAVAPAPTTIGPTETQVFHAPLSRRTYWSMFRKLLSASKRMRKRAHLLARLDRPDRPEVAILDEISTDAAVLRQACRSRGFGVNDLLLAALASALTRQGDLPWARSLDMGFLLGSAVGERRSEALRQSGYLGPCVSDMLITIESPRSPLTELAAEIASATKAGKAGGDERIATTAVRLSIIRDIWPWMGIRRNAKTFRKWYPVSGGDTAVSIDDVHFPELTRNIHRYVRVCPTGPSLPLLLAPTILDGRLTLTLTYRTAYLTGQQAHVLLRDIADSVTKFCQGGESEERAA